MACTDEYKAAVEGLWGKLLVLQQMGFMIWAQSLDITGRRTKQISQLYATRAANQVGINKILRYIFFRIFHYTGGIFLRNYSFGCEKGAYI